MILKKYWKTLIWAIVIAILSSIPGDDVSKIKLLNIRYMDKLAHFGLYFILAFAFLFEAHNNRLSLTIKNATLVLILSACIGYGIIMEFLQYSLFRQRSAEIMDFVANALGSIASLVIFLIVKKRFSKSA